MGSIIEFPVKQIPNYIKIIGQTLINNGYKAYVVGGSIRDLLLEKETKDFDIATDATPEMIIQLFPNSISIGRKFGNIIVISEDEYGEKYEVDVTTFRKDSEYIQGRWPSKVTYSKSIKDDLSRRDFTINAMAINLKQVINDPDQMIPVDSIISPFQGLEDLLSKKIEAVGNADERMKEDGLRAFRACRFAAELNFTISNSLIKAIKNNLNTCNMISRERIRDEINKLLKYAKKPSIAFKLFEETGLLNNIIPELVESKYFYQPKYHSDNLFEHSLLTMDTAADNVKLAALFHDIGKIKTKTIDKYGIHYYGHDTIGAKIAKQILQNLKYPNKTINNITTLIKHHMFYFPTESNSWSDHSIIKLIQDIGNEELLQKLIELRIADANSNSKNNFHPEEILSLQKRISEIYKKNTPINMTDLKITGNDLKEIGIVDGKKIGRILKQILFEVQKNPELNSYSQLIELAKTHNNLILSNSE